VCVSAEWQTFTGVNAADMWWTESGTKWRARLWTVPCWCRACGLSFTALRLSVAVTNRPRVHPKACQHTLGVHIQTTMTITATILWPPGLCPGIPGVSWNFLCKVTNFFSLCWNKFIDWISSADNLFHICGASVHKSSVSNLVTPVLP